MNFTTHTYEPSYPVDKYKNTVVYPSFPPRPLGPLTNCPEENSRYVKQHDKYVKDLAAYSEGVERFKKEERRLRALYEADLLAKYGLANHPKAKEALAFAVELGENDPPKIEIILQDLSFLML